MANKSYSKNTTCYSLENKSVPKGSETETVYSSKKAFPKFQNAGQGTAPAYKIEAKKLG